LSTLRYNADKSWFLTHSLYSVVVDEGGLTGVFKVFTPPGSGDVRRGKRTEQEVRILQRGSGRWLGGR
jgi:hypothetical protein